MNELNLKQEQEPNEQMLAEQAIATARKEGFASFTTSLDDLDQTITQLTEFMSAEQKALLEPLGLAKPVYGNTDFAPSAHSIGGPDAFLGKLESAGPKGLTAVVITGGEGKMPVIRGRKAAEIGLTEGTVVIFNTDSDDRKKLPWFTVESTEKVESVWIENSMTKYERRNAPHNDPALGALGRRAVRGAMGREQSKVSKRLARKLK